MGPAGGEDSPLPGCPVPELLVLPEAALWSPSTGACHRQSRTSSAATRSSVEADTRS